MDFSESLEESRLIAILRGIRPEEVLEVASILVEGGIKILEVPLDSPEVFKSIELLTTFYKDNNDIHIGAGTVCTQDDVNRLKQIKATLIISPNTDANIIQKTKELGLVSIPGFLTPSEAYSAINAGATSLKLFPFRKFGISYYNDIKVVLPKDMPIIAVGGIDESNIAMFMESDIKYFGLGSSLYKPGIDLRILKEKVDFFVNAVKTNNV